MCPRSYAITPQDRHSPQLETWKLWNAKFSKGVALFSPRRDGFYFFFLSVKQNSFQSDGLLFLSLREFSLPSSRWSTEFWDPQFVLQAVTVTILAPATFDHIGSRSYSSNPKQSPPSGKAGPDRQLWICHQAGCQTSEKERSWVLLIEWFQTH